MNLSLIFKIYTMVCLNEKLPINLKQMKSVFLKELDEIIENEIYYLNGINDEKKDKLKNNIIKKMNNKFNSDFFIYRIIHNEHCTYKHQRGKNDGKFCCKRITNNGNKTKFVCTIHNKEHIPRKK